MNLSNELGAPEARLEATESLARHDSQVAEGCEFRERAHSAGTGSFVCLQSMPVNSYQAAPAKGVICQTGSRTSVMIANVQEKALSVAHNNQSQTSARSSSPRLSGNNVSSPHASPRGGSFKAPQRPRTDRSCTESSTCEAQTIELLAKTCFTCTLVGDRQSGKRTIVKCFIKLLNEFKLASQEYRREKMLAKLLDCSERLQTLSIPTHSGQHKSKASDSALGSPAKVSPRARVNSWFAEGKKLLNLSVKANKSRLDPISAGRLTSPGQLASQHQQKPTGSANLVEHIPVDQSGNQYEQPSRSRALALEVADTDPQLLETTSFRSPSGSVSDNSGSCDSSSICSSTGSGPSSLELSAQASKSIINRRSRLDDCNKSDFNINYHADRVSADTSRASRALEGRWADNSKLTVTGVTLGQRRSLNERYLADSSLDSLSRDGKLGASTNSLIVNRNRSEPEPAPQPNQFEYNDTISKPNRIPRISLKQLNKRRYKVKFSTRRLLSSKYLLDTPTGAKAKLPDCFMVVYAINDR